MTGWGYHDVAAAGVVHTIAGWFAFGVLLNLGPRIGKYNEDGSANEIEGHSLVSSFIGLLMLIVGFFGFLGFPTFPWFPRGCGCPAEDEGKTLRKSEVDRG